ncbi:MAG: SIS domain-containing protein [Aminipila sp.]
MSKNSIDIIKNLIIKYPILEKLEVSLLQAFLELKACYKNGGKVLTCGNGGSASDSLHIVGELMKNFVKDRKIDQKLQNDLESLFPDEAEFYTKNLQGCFPALSLVNEVSLLTAYSNDNIADLAFAQQIVGYGKKQDVLIAISTSGNSKNIIHAAKISKAIGIKVISLTGESGGELKNLSDVCINVPSNITYEIQELHLPIYHALCLALEHEFFGGEE